jgi:hypothetical protein
VGGCGLWGKFRMVIPAVVGRASSIGSACDDFTLNPHPLQNQTPKGAPPKFVFGLYVSATLYEGVGFVERHVDCSRPRGSFFSYLKESFSFLHFDQGSLHESCGGNWFHQPSIRSPYFRP